MNNLSLQAGVTMSSREIAELTGKQHGHVMRDIKKMLAELELDQSLFGDIFFDEYNREQPMFRLNRETTDCLLTGYSAKMRMAVIKRWHELESSKLNTLSIPNFADPAEAAIAWAEQYRAAQLAISTKAEIGSRREATAMNTASQAVKKANALQVELDRSQEWSTIKRMEIITGLKFNWRILKSAGVDLGIDPKEVFDPNFGTVKSYHADVWKEAYALDIKQ